MKPVKTIADAVREFGPIDDWLITAEDIERIMLTATCSHGILPVDRCMTCFVGALVARQLAILAERAGCSPDDAAALGAELVRREQEADA